MSGHIVWGTLIILVGFGITLFLLRFSFIRKNPVLLITTIVNPGLVGVAAGLAFYSKPLFPALTRPLVFLTFGLLILSLPLIIIFLPRVMMEEMTKKTQADSGSEETPSETIESQGGEE